MSGVDARDGAKGVCMKGGGQEGYFLQSSASLRGKNAYLEDAPLQELLAQLLPPSSFELIHADLVNFGARVTGDVALLAKEAGREENKPRLEPFDGWGRRVDEIVVSRAWKDLHGVAAEEGIIALGYERNSDGSRKGGEYGRVHQMCKLYLFSPVAAMVTCPLAMTDGACRLLDQLQLDQPDLKNAFNHFTSRHPDQFWTSGQWMTERTGGSDVSKTETIAVIDPNHPVDSNRYRLTGYKYFTSATTSQVAFTLARVEGKGLGLFMVMVRDLETGEHNNLVVHRLKKKLGTDEVPTAELELRGTRALMIGKPGEGVKVISYLFNITRIHAAMGGVAALRRILLLARDYADKRAVFGSLLRDSPLHLQTLSRMEVTCRAQAHIVFHVAHMLGRSEVDPQDKRSANLVRILTPLVKLFTSKECTAALAEGLESFGGAGYMEDTGLPKLLRDQIVNTIWEGTTNVLALDVVRAIRRSPKCFEYFITEVDGVVHAASAALRHVTDASQALDDGRRFLASARDALESHMGLIRRHAVEEEGLLHAVGHHATATVSARDFAYAMAHTYASSRLVHHALQTGKHVDAYVAMQYTVKHFSSPHALLQSPAADAAELSYMREIVTGQGHAGKSRM